MEPPQTFVRTSLTPGEFRDLIHPPKVDPSEPSEEWELLVNITKTQVEKLIEYLKFHDIHGTLHRVSQKEE